MTTRSTEVLIVGGGPVGLQLGHDDAALDRFLARILRERGLVHRR